MTNEEAKKYCIDVIGMSKDDFVLASDEDIAYECAKDGDWVHHYKYSNEHGTEYGMQTSVEIAVEHKFWNNEDNVDTYIDFMMTKED